MRVTAIDWTAVATVVLAVGALISAGFAIAAFRKQATEVETLQKQAIDEHEAIEQQGKLLKVQSDQLEVQQKQLTAQQEVNNEQLVVLNLQADDLQASVEQRQRETAERHRAQAVKVFMWEERFDQDPRIGQAEIAAGVKASYLVRGWVENRSDLPIYDVLTSWHLGTMPRGTTVVTAILLPGQKMYSEKNLPDDFPSTGDPTNLGAVAFFRDAAGIYWRSRPDGRLEEIPPDELPPHSW
jgi:hypothetical protein